MTEPTPTIPDAALAQHIAILGKTRSGKSSVMRARAWCMRDGFSDVLKGLGIREEVEDYGAAAIEQPVRVARPASAAAALDTFARPAEPKPPVTIEHKPEIPIAQPAESRQPVEAATAAGSAGSRGATMKDIDREYSNRPSKGLVGRRGEIRAGVQFLAKTSHARDLVLMTAHRIVVWLRRLMGGDGQFSGSYTRRSDGARIQMTPAEVEEIREQSQAEAADRRRRNPDQETALLLMMDAHVRLREMGWREAMYCPKDGSWFEAIEAGSTGIHRCQYRGEWPDGHWWIQSDGDLWPSQPILFRLYPEDEARRKAKMAEAAARYRAEQAP